MSKLVAAQEALAILLIAIARGSVIGVVAVGFLAGSSWLFKTIVGADNLHPLLLLIFPVTAGVISGAICRTLPTGAPLGPADVIRSSIEGRRFVSFVNAIKSALAAFSALALGASVGAYGALVHLGSSLGIVGVKQGDDRKLRVGLASGCAAAIAASFGAPLAGIVFAHEVVVGHYSLRTFVPVATSSLTAYWITLFGLGRNPFITVPTISGIGVTDILVFILIGLGSGLVAALVIEVCINITKHSRRLLAQAWLLPVAAGAITGLIAMAGLPEVLGSGGPLVEQLVGGEHDPGYVTALFIGKFIASVACIGLGMAGGLFSPALTIGALFGTIIGYAASFLFGAAAPPVYVCALVGMFATAAPVIGAPLAGILLAVELSTSSYFGTAVAIAIVLATLISSKLVKGSYYQRQLEAAGITFASGPEQRIFEQITVSQRMIPGQAESAEGLVTVTASTNLWQAMQLAEQSHADLLAVIDSEGNYVGKLDIKEVLVEMAAHLRRNRAEEKEF